MIIDQFGVFFDDEAAAAGMTSKTVNFMSYSGREDPIYISLLAKGGNASAVTFNVDVQQSADDSTFTTAGSFTVSKPDASAVLTSQRLPVDVKEKFVRLSVSVTGTATGVTLFAAVTRDHVAPYDKGLFITRGKVAA